MRERANARFVPRRSVTVVFEGRDTPEPTESSPICQRVAPASGATPTSKAGQQVTLAVSFARASRPVPAEARVVWTGPGSKPGASRYGVQWDAETPEAAHLRRLISESA